MRHLLPLPLLHMLRVGAALFVAVMAPFVCFHSVASMDAPHSPHLVFLQPSDETAGQTRVGATDDTVRPAIGLHPTTAIGDLLLLTGLLVACATARLQLAGLTFLRRVPAFHRLSVIPLCHPPVDPPPRPA